MPGLPPPPLDGQLVISVKIDALSQPFAEHDGGPARALAIVSDQAVAFGGGVQRVLDVELVQRADGDPCSRLHEDAEA
jgi:hypothetical protein